MSERLTTDLREVRDGIEELIRDVSPHVRSQEYGIIIGDDTSGRLPALVLYRAINAFNAERGYPRIPIMFIESAREDDQLPELYDAFAARQRIFDSRIPGRRALIVTEGITSGGAIARLGKILIDHGVRFDVAAVDGENFGLMRSERETRTTKSSLVGEWLDDVRRVNGNVDEEVLALLDTEKLLANRRLEDLEKLMWKIDRGEALTRDDIDGLRRRPRFRKDQGNLERSDLVSCLVGQFRSIIARHYLREASVDELAALQQRLLDGRTSRAKLAPETRSLLGLLWKIHEGEGGYSGKAFPGAALRKATADIVDAIANTPAEAIADDHPDHFGWPRSTRLYCGNNNAGDIRDRADLSGITREKFSRQPLTRSPELAASVRAAREDVNLLAREGAGDLAREVATMENSLG